MFPGVYGFSWETSRLIFLGLFYAVALVLAGTLLVSIRRAVRDLGAGRADEIRWRRDFRALPVERRACRHMLSGRVADRTCPNAFDCSHCVDHARFEKAAAAEQRAGAGAQPALAPSWFNLPPDRLYHRGHTWVRPEEDRTVTVGLDDFAGRVIGPPDRVIMPPVGARLRANGTGWVVEAGGTEVRILSPIDGEVLGTGGPGLGWYLRMRPERGRLDTRPLLAPCEAAPWILREVERLQISLGGSATGALLADGGEPVPDLHAAIPEARRDEILGDLLLDP